MSGQLVLDWGQLENFLITRDRPVYNKVTNINCQSWALYVQMQSTIALANDAQQKGKVFVTPKIWLQRHNRKTY